MDKKMRLVLFGVLFSMVILGCTKTSKTIYKSDNQTSFQLKLVDDETGRHVFNEFISGEKCSVSLTQVGGKDALAIQTSDEFSDAWLNVQNMFGYPINIAESRFLSMKIYVPSDSWICALKLNFKDAAGNNGGCKEIFNNFYGYYDQWLNVVVDMQDILHEYQNWGGEENSMLATTMLSLNPYCGHQADSSVIYVNDIVLSDKKPKLNFHPRQVAPVDSVENIPFKITFDDEPFLRTIMAYRGFESTYQALAKGIGGNETMALRIKGKPGNKYFCFLPEFEKITGYPLDFTKVKRLYFSYYLTENSDDFDGSWLFLTTKGWDDILVDKDFYSNFKKGSWQNLSIDVDNLDLEKVKGDKPVLPNVYDLRIDLQYRPDGRNIEMWIDDFGWE